MYVYEIYHSFLSRNNINPGTIPLVMLSTWNQEIIPWARGQETMQSLSRYHLQASPECTERPIADKQQDSLS